MKTARDKRDFVDIATLLILFFGLVIAGWALTVYIKQAEELHNQNRIQMSMSLRSAENVIYEMIFKNEYLGAFFADAPDKEDFSFADAQRYVNLLLENGGFYGWNNVEELISRIYEPRDNYLGAKKKKLREAFDLAEHLLYLLEDAHSARQAHILSEAEYETWITYVDDIGFNPLFLSALYYGHSSGYMTKDFASHIKERLLRSKRNKQAVSILYKELLDQDWINKLGKRGYDDRMKISSNQSMQRIADRSSSH